MERLITLPDPFRALAEKVGGVASLAKVLGATKPGEPLPPLPRRRA